MSQVFHCKWAYCPETKAQHQHSGLAYKDPEPECLVYRQMETEACRPF